MVQIKVHTPNEASRILRVGRSKIYELLRSGKLKSIRNGRRFLIPDECIVEFIKSQVYTTHREGDEDA